MLELPADLVDLIAAAPDDPQTYLVAADWLQQRGDPWGELVGLAVGRTRETDRAAWRAEMDRVLAACDPYDRRAHHYRVRWAWGAVDRVVYVGRSPRAAASELRDLLAHPAARLARELVVLDDGAGLAPLYDAIAAANLPALRSLQLVALEDASADALPIERALAAFPHLEHLDLDGRPTGALAHARLASLALPGTHPADLAYVDLPALARLAWPDRGDAVDQLANDPRRFPRLRELAITTTAPDRARAVELRATTSSLAHQLYLLDVRVATARGAIADRRFPLDRAGDHIDVHAPRAAALHARANHHAVTTYLVHSPFTIGTHHDASICLANDPLAAMHQATIEHGPEGWLVRDHGPELPSRLGGRPVERAQLRAGDELWFGLTSMVFDDDVDLG